MDVERARRSGISNSRLGWLTNPVRAVLWRLILPYVETVADGIHGLETAVARLDVRLVDLDDRCQRLDRALEGHDARRAETAAKLQMLEQTLDGYNPRFAEIDTKFIAVDHAIESHLGRLAEIDGSIQRLAAAVHAYEFRFADADAKIDAVATQPPQVIRRLTSHFDGIRKDLTATAYRLGSIEARLQDEAARAERLERQGAWIERLQEWLNALSKENAALSSRTDKLERRIHAHAARRTEPDRDRLSVVTSPMGRFLVWPHDLIGGVVFAGETWEPHVREAIERNAQPERIAVDAGAYIGLHTVHLSRLFREVYAFEPQREMFQVLCDNLALNSCRNVRAYNNALYDHACAMRLATNEHQEIPVPFRDGDVDYGAIDNAAALAFEVQEDGDGSVRALTIDGLRLDDVGFIKVDTQGADLRVLQGGVDTIRRCRPVVVFEYERELAATHGVTREAMLAFFEALDYDTDVLHITSPDRQLDYIALPR